MKTMFFTKQKTIDEEYEELEEAHEQLLQENEILIGVIKLLRNEINTDQFMEYLP